MSRQQRIAAVLALWVLAPWAAECSWGGFALRDYAIVVIFLAPMYGGAVVLIREAVRRTGRGWPTIALLGAAFGVFMVGLVDHSAFNTGYLDDTEYADLIRDLRLRKASDLVIAEAKVGKAKKKAAAKKTEKAEEAEGEEKPKRTRKKKTEETEEPKAE